MPELPEVETVVRELTPLKNYNLVSIKLHWPKTITPDFKFFKKAVLKHKVIKVFRRAKYICIELDNGHIITVHLRMTGKLLFEPNERDQKYVRAEFLLEKSSKKLNLYFSDVRKFGRIDLFLKDQDFLPQLGPEPLDSKSVFDALSSCTSSRAIKKVLLDQNVLVGIGNIYADEALFACKIHPEKPFNKLKPKNFKDLAKHIPIILNNAINNMGTTLSDYRNTKNIAGENQNYLKAYGQYGQPCTRCNATITKITVGGRTSSFCPKCQKL